MSDSTFHDLPILGELGDALDAAFLRETAADEAAHAPGPARPSLRERVRRRLGLSGFLAPVVLVTLGVGTAAATLTVLRGSPIPIPRRADVQSPMAVDPGTERVSALRAADPGGGVPFALRIGKSQAGLTCATVGQAKDGRFGVVGFDGAFRAMPPEILDGCGQAGDAAVAVLGARTFDAPKPDDVRTVLYVVGGDQLRRVELNVRGVDRDLPLDGDGNALLALSGYPEDNGVRLRLHFDDGKVVSQSLVTGFSLAVDPSGPAWRVDSMGALNGPVPGSCTQVRRLRSSATTPQLPQACGLPVQQDVGAHGAAVFFDLRRFHGHQSGVSTQFGRAQKWAWHGAPARTIVWGGADPKTVRAITVRGEGAGNVARAAPSINGSFVAILPVASAEDQVTVDVEHTDGRHETFTKAANLVQMKAYPASEAP